MLIYFIEKEKINIEKKEDVSINRNKFEEFLNEKGFDKDSYSIICKNLADEYNDIYSYISEIRIKYDLDFNLWKNKTEPSDYDCPEIFYARFI